MTNPTTPDGIRYPASYAVPADVPSDMQKMADDVQAALNRRMPIATSKVNIGRADGWGNNFPSASKSGKLVVLSSYFQRDAVLSVTATGGYTVGTLPAGYRPFAVERLPCAWSAGGVRRSGQVWIFGDGTIDWYPMVTVSLAVDDFVSVSGVVFVTP